MTELLANMTGQLSMILMDESDVWSSVSGD